MNNSRQVSLIIALVVFVFAVLIGLYAINYHFAQNVPGGRDFLPRWMGAQYWVMRGINPYDPQVSLASQRALYGHPADPEQGEDKAHFLYPLNAMLVFFPFGPLNFTLARALWMTLLELSLLALSFISLRLARWNPGVITTLLVIIFFTLGYHSFRTIISGQIAALITLFLILALLGVQKHHDVAAGVLLALSLAKPTMVFLLIPFVLLWAISTGRRDILLSFFVTVIFILGVSLVLLPSWPLDWLRQLVDFVSYTPDVRSPLSMISGVFPGIAQPFSIFLHSLMIGYLLIEWLLAMRKDDRWFFWTAALTLVVTVWVAYRSTTNNFVLLLPVVLLIFKMWEERWQMGGRVGAIAVLIILGLGIWGLFWLTSQGKQESYLLYLPLPLFCLIGLWWIRWWAIRPPRVLIDQLVRDLG